MAFLSGGVNFTGSMGDFSAYRMRGSEKIIIRRKGGPGRNRIKQDRNYAVTRLNNEEWKACTAATAQVIRNLFPVKHLSGYRPYAGSLNGLFKSIQKEDTASPLGKRRVLLSQYYSKLEGFSLNREHNFESFVKHPLQYSIDKANGSAALQLPEIIPGINLANPNGHPLYRFVFVLGAVTDIVYNETKKMYTPAAVQEVFPAVAATAWHTWKEKMEAAEVTLSFTNPAGLDNYTLLLAAGIEFGIPVTHTEVRPVKRDGAAKILKMM